MMFFLKQNREREEEQRNVTDLGLRDGGGVVLDDDGQGGDDDGDSVHAVEGRQQPLHERDLRRAAHAQRVQVRLLPLPFFLPLSPSPLLTAGSRLSWSSAASIVLSPSTIAIRIHTQGEQCQSGSNGFQSFITDQIHRSNNI
jgi:hypothetical protein